VIWLLVAGVVAQGADAATMRLDLELNPLVLSLGPLAYLAKISLIVGVTMLAWALPRLKASSRRSKAWAMLLSCELLVSGLLGACSNLP
jgi:hypothetical protein